MATAKEMRKRLTIIFAALSLTACIVIVHATPAQDRLWATRVKCELQTAGAASLPDLVWQQGTTPLLSVEQFRLGKAIAADTNTDAVVVIGPSAMSQYYVAVTNQSTSGNSYLVQMPTIGTNTASGVWWYTVYFERDGRRYWTGNGALTIEATTSTGDGLVWQTITGVSVAALQSALDAEAQARAAGDAVATIALADGSADATVAGWTDVQAIATVHNAIVTVNTSGKLLVANGAAYAGLDSASIAALNARYVFYPSIITNVGAYGPEFAVAVRELA